MKVEYITVLKASDEEWKEILLIEEYRLFSKEQQEMLLEKIKEFQ